MYKCKKVFEGIEGGEFTEYHYRDYKIVRINKCWNVAEFEEHFYCDRFNTIRECKNTIDIYRLSE